MCLAIVERLFLHGTVLPLCGRVSKGFAQVWTYACLEASSLSCAHWMTRRCEPSRERGCKRSFPGACVHKQGLQAIKCDVEPNFAHMSMRESR